MANRKTFTQYMQDIQNAAYGSEVREAIYYTIADCYDDVTNREIKSDIISGVIADKIADGSFTASVISNLNFITETTNNLFDPFNVTVGRLNTSTGDVNAASTTYITSDHIPVISYESGITFFCANTTDRVAYNSSKEFIGTFGASATLPSNTAYIRVSGLKTNLGSIEVNAGTNISYISGRSAVDQKARKDLANVYNKSYIDDRFNNISDLIALTEDQKQDLIDLLDEEEE